MVKQGRWLNQRSRRRLPGPYLGFWRILKRHNTWECRGVNASIATSPQRKWWLRSCRSMMSWLGHTMTKNRWHELYTGPWVVTGNVAKVKVLHELHGLIAQGLAPA